MPEKIACNICGSAEASLVKTGVYGNPDQNIYRCHACEHVYLAPLLDDSEEAGFYHDQYSSFLLGRGDSKSVNPQEHFTGNKNEADRRFEDIRHILSKEQSVLEIGSASGFFLSRIKDYVKDGTGVEQNAAHKDFANGRNIRTVAGFEELGDRKFDVIFMYYLLEHIKHPVDFIRRIKKLLRGGTSRIVVEVPNINEALVSLYKSLAYNEFVWQRAHCSYFSVKVLRDIFTGLGFKTEFVPVQRYDFSNHIYWLAEGKPGGSEKYSHVFSNALDAQYRKELKKHWLCDSIFMVAEQDRKEET